MTFSYLIVTRNRPNDLEITLGKLQELVRSNFDEVLVFIDGCSKTEYLKNRFPWVKWTISKVQLGASPARNKLYSLAQNDILIGLDDDAHPLEVDFKSKVISRFRESEKTAIIAFQEITGVFKDDLDALSKKRKGADYYTNEFVGCGFAIRKEVYDSIAGFPKWMDIYGEETAVALQVLDRGFDVLYSYDLAVNHRKDALARRKTGANYFRFEKQLINTIALYIIYYPKPIKKILKVIWHNGRKYAFQDATYLKCYFRAVFKAIGRVPMFIKNRKPVKGSTVIRRNNLQGIQY